MGNIIYEIQEEKIREAHFFIEKSIYDLECKLCILRSDIRISIPKIFLDAMGYYHRKMLDSRDQHINKFQDVTIIENYKNEIAVFCIYFERLDKEFIKILNLE
jgi:hypothetical protein